MHRCSCVQGRLLWVFALIASAFVIRVFLVNYSYPGVSYLHPKQLAKLVSTFRGLPVEPRPCKNVLSWAVRGKWVPRDHTKQELDKVMAFFNKTRSYHKIPASLQRADKKCGNVVLGKTKMHPYRALCDPAGSTPCCYSNHKCVALSPEHCMCDRCMDVRQAVHAEFATWTPARGSCQLTMYSSEADICPVLLDATVHFMGDSYIRQLYIAFLALLRTGHADGIFAQTNSSRAVIKRCDPYFVYFRECKWLIPTKVSACADSLQVRLTHTLMLQQHAEGVLNQAKAYMGKPNTFLVLWVGAWDRFNLNKVNKTLLTPLKDLLQNSSWPHVLWVSAHSPWILKSPTYTLARADRVLAFNTGVEKILKGVFQVVDFFHLTEKDGVQSYDGSHYGPGVNTLKAQVLLNYFAELRREGDGGSTLNDDSGSGNPPRKKTTEVKQSLRSFNSHNGRYWFS